MGKLLLVLCGAVCVPMFCLGAVIHVPGDYPNIQLALNFSISGDTVLVADGTYTGDWNKGLDFQGKEIHLLSENGAETCFIDCENFGRALTFDQGETANAIVSGFTIKNGSALGFNPENKGGAIYVLGASPTILNCVLDTNTALNYGGGIYLGNSSSIVDNCTFLGNESEQYGAGLYATSNSSPTITNCLFHSNIATDYGGGLWVGNINTPHQVSNCTISNNSPDGISCDWKTEITNCEIVNNIGYGAYFLSSSSGSVLSECLISGNNLTGMYCLGQISVSDSIISNNGSAGMYLGGNFANTVLDCVFSSNSGNHGGGIRAGFGITEFFNCKFIANSTTSGGGGIRSIYESSIILNNCLVAGNSADYGGGIFVAESASVIASNCTFSENLATISGGGVFGTGNITFNAINSIFWGDLPEEILGTGLQITYSTIQSGWPGEGNLSFSPYFASGPSGDYYISQMAAGQPQDSRCWNAGSDLSTNICFTFPDDQVCMNELTTRTDEWPDDSIVDMGYHYQRTCPNHGDVNFSGDITAGDAQLTFEIAMGTYSPSFEEECAADCNSSGDITAGDAQAVFQAMLGMGQCEDPI